MTDLFFIRARLRRDAAGSNGALIRLVADVGLRPGHLHHLVWTLFGDEPGRERDFVFRVDRRDGRPEVLAYAPRPPVSADLWDVTSKPFAPDLRHGDRLRFRVRINPVVQRQRRRIDIVYDALRRARELTASEFGDAVKELPDRLILAQKHGATWFADRAPGLGLELEGAVTVADYRNERLHKRSGGRNAEFRLSSLDLSGYARVLDPEAVRRALARGVGRGKAYGCGMLLIARA